MPPKKASSSKRKASPHDESSPEPAKKRAKSSGKNAKQTHISTDSADKLEKPIMINRAPVLELWAACVAQFLHPDLSWTACLSIGGSISALTAITKGRSLGKIDPPDEDGEEGDGKKKTGSKDLKVMGFPTPLEGDAVLVKGKARPGREGSLIRRYGGEETLGEVKKAMMQALESWKGHEDELDKGAFHMYETFRPSVPKGQQGWGRKAELHLPNIESTVARSS